MAITDVQRVQGNYTIKTANQGIIRLDTGATTGTVVVTGNLDVQGTTTTIESVNSTIKDNILTLNYGQQAAPGNIGQVSLGTSGLLIDRGNSGDTTLAATLLYDDRKVWKAGSNVYPGVFEFAVNNNATAISVGAVLIDAKAPTSSGRQAIYLIGRDATNAVLTLEGISYNYEQNIPIPSDPYNKSQTFVNDIPNVGWVVDYVKAASATPVNIRRLNQLNSSLTLTDNGINAPTLTLNLGGPLVRSTWKEDGEYTQYGTAGGISLLDTAITALPLNAGDDASLNLYASERGSIHLKNYMVLDPSIITGPDIASLQSSIPSGATAIYTTATSKTVTSGGTGIFFVNSNNKVDGNGNGIPEELVSRRRALVYAIVF